MDQRSLRIEATFNRTRVRGLCDWSSDSGVQDEIDIRIVRNGFQGTGDWPRRRGLVCQTIAGGINRILRAREGWQNCLQGSDSLGRKLRDLNALVVRSVGNDVACATGRSDDTHCAAFERWARAQ